MISNMHFKDIKCLASINESKKKKNENIIIKTNVHIQNIRLINFTERRTCRTNYATSPINTLNLKAKVPFLAS